MKQLLPLFASQVSITITQHESDCYALGITSYKSECLPEKKLLFPDPFRPTIHMSVPVLHEDKGGQYPQRCAVD
jgi:hypothetical protein